MAVIGGRSGMTPQIGPLLRGWRTAGGLTLGKLAQKSGIDKSALSRWESGGRQPRVPELEATLDALNASPAQRAQAFSLIDAPRSIRRLRQRPDIQGLGAPPAAGDLLRAMRLRKRQTQEAVAAQLGVRQGTVARWERGERLPAAEQVQALCYFLEAHEEEFVALTLGRFSELSTEDTQGSAGEQEERLLQTLESIIMGYGPDGPADLILLTLERKAWALAIKRESARSLFARLLSHHAEMLRNSERWAEVGPLAHRALALAPRQAKESDFILRAEIMSAAAQVYAGSRLAPQHGLYSLKELLTHTMPPVFTAWIQSDMAKYAALNGEMALSLSLAQQAVETARMTNDPMEIYLRRMDYGRLLLKAGRFEAALQELPNPYQTIDAPQGGPQLADDLLIHAEAYLAAGHSHEAHEWLNRSIDVIETYKLHRSYDLIENYKLDCLRAAANALGERF